MMEDIGTAMSGLGLAKEVLGSACLCLSFEALGKPEALKAAMCACCIGSENESGEILSTSSTQTWKSPQTFKTVFQKSSAVVLI